MDKENFTYDLLRPIDYGRVVEDIEDRQEAMKRMIKLETIAQSGLGYGEGGISVQTRLENPNDPLTDEIVDIVETATGDPEATVDITDKLDTCADGRCAVGVRTESADGEVIEEVEASFYSKVFGGGDTMLAASDVALGRAPASVTDTFAKARLTARQHKINTGAHSSTHASSDKSDCGAIDKSPLIFENIAAFEPDIRGSLDTLFGPEASGSEEFQSLADEAFANFRSYINTEEFKRDDYSGTKTVNGILHDGSPVKILDGEHREIRVRINADLPGKTTNQGHLRTKSGDVAQVFAWDFPRNLELAQRAYDHDRERKQAVVGQVIYSLSTAATLTAGDLPVDVVYKNSRYLKLSF